MQIEVVSRRENPLLKRTEVRFRVSHPKESSPARDALRAELAKALKATKDIVVIGYTRSAFGRPVSEGFAKVYKSREDAMRTERSFILVRNRLKEAEVREKKEPAPKPPKPAPEAKEAPKPAEKPAPAEPRKEAAKPEAPKKEAAKKEGAPKKDEKPAEKKAGKEK